MYAIIKLGTQQFKVENQTVFLAQKTGLDVGAEFEASVLFMAADNKVHIGTPLVNSGKVSVKVIENLRSEKIHGFKYKKRKNYHRSWGHRQDLQKLQITNMTSV